MQNSLQNILGKNFYHKYDHIIGSMNESLILFSTIKTFDIFDTFSPYKTFLTAQCSIVIGFGLNLYILFNVATECRRNYCGPTDQIIIEENFVEKISNLIDYVYKDNLL